MKFIFTIFLLLVQKGAFAQITETSGLEFKLSTSWTQLFDEPQVRCRDEILGITPQTFVKAPGFTYESFEFQWFAKDTSFEFLKIQVTFQDPIHQKNYGCTLQDEELMAVLGGKTKIEARDAKRYRSRCSIRCGDMPKTLFPESNQTLKGSLKIHGFESDGVDLFLPALIEIPVSIQN